jgi:hypothetical protein
MGGESGGVEEDLEYCGRCGGEVTGKNEGKRGVSDWAIDTK